MFRISCVWLLATALLSAGPSCAQSAMPRSVGLSAALALAFEQSPQLQTAQAAVGANQGALRQAGALPNPVLGAQAENLGADTAKGSDSVQVTYGVSQLIEIGGKRSARQSAADHALAVSNAEYQLARLDLIRNVTTAYAEAAAAKEDVALAEKQKVLAGEVLQNVARRVSAAAEPLYQRSKAEVALATSEIALDKARRDYTIARRQLAALWAAESSDYDVDATAFHAIAPPEPLPASIRDNPALRRWQAEVARSRAAAELEEANAIPDPTFNAGLRDFRDSGDSALVVGVSIPIPLFDANQGNIARAQSEVSRAVSQQRTAEISLGADLLRNQQELENAYRQAQSLKGTVIPAAEKAYALSRQGYNAGRFPYLEVLDAQRTLVAARTQYNTTLKQYHTSLAEVARLTAVSAEQELKEGH